MGLSLHNKPQSSSTIEYEQWLRNAGFNKYEAAAYLTLLKEGFTDANLLSRGSRIPMGKIYAVLDNLQNMGFVEVQHSRPKKYRAIEANIALENYFMQKENEMQRGLSTLRKTLDDLKKALSHYSIQEEREKHFWSAAMGNEEVMKMIANVYHEAKNEICVVVPGNIRSMKSNQFKNKFASMFHGTLLPLVKKGIKIRMIDPNPALSESLREWHNSAEDELLIQKLSKNLEVKALDIQNRFILIDLDLVLLEITDPLSVDKIYGMVKIYDRELSNELHAKFEEFWQNGENQLSYG